jgi:LruC domain-containing protein
LLYSVDGTGNLHAIDPVSGASNNIGYVGVSGTFGAVYFDVNGKFYISDNNSGIIYRIDVSSIAPAAEIFAYGPNSGNNDGARCALAPIIPVGEVDPTIDYGDAPDSFGTLLADNGARHQMIASLYIGDILSGTDDGVTFVTGFEAASDTIVRIKATGAGYINSWIDWNQNGVFDNSEQVITDQLMSEGFNNVLIDVPYDTALGDTWMRVRYSTTTGIGPKGGVADGEVEDHVITVLAANVSITPYPSSTGWVTLAYEDLWPKLGDYDTNDVNFAYRTSVHNFGDTHVVGYTIEGELLAYGAGYHNGFAIQLDNIASNNIDVNSVVFKINDVLQAASPLEDNGADDAVIIITNDVKSYLPLYNDSYFYRAHATDTRVKADTPLTFSVTVTLTTPVALGVAPSNTLNPFIFATPYTYRGDSFAYQPGRSLEIHLKNKKVSSRFNPNFFGMDDDKDTNSVGGTTFISENNMPWAIELPNLWNHPKERVDLIVAYPEFTGFVNSGGTEKTTWYTSDKAASGKVKDNQ